MKKAVTIKSLGLALCLTLIAAAAPASVRAAEAVQQTPVPLAFLKSERITLRGKLVKAERIVDRAGEHILVVTLRSGPSSGENASPGAIERFELFAVLYTRKENRWSQTWMIQDNVDCPGLDSNAEFFPEYITVTDLDKNGIAEVTVPYKMFCGGGRDAGDLKIIMRQGEQKFALRGRYVIDSKQGTPDGGEMTLDKSLSLKENAAFKAHLLAIRLKVYIES